MTKDLVELVRELAKFPALQLVLVGAVGSWFWWIYLRANKIKAAAPAPATPGDGNRPATLFDLLQQIERLRKDISAAISSRSGELFNRLGECEQGQASHQARLDAHHARLQALESPQPPRRRRKIKSAQ
jgi:hypothetical protein